jgi:hypothetical protein
MLGRVLQEGFVTVNRSVRLVFLDVLWKTAWLILTVVLFFLFVSLIAAELQSIEWDASAAPNNPLLAAVLLRQWWEMYAASVIAGLAAVFAVSTIAWLLMESYFRSRLLKVESSVTESSILTGRSRLSRFSVFLASGIARTLILLSAIALVLLLTFGPLLTAPYESWGSLWRDARGAGAVGLTVFIVLAFMITVTDTLIRSDAVQLLGSHMFEVAGVVGTLLLVEACIAVSGGLAVAAALLRVSGPMESLMAAAMALLTAFCLSALHSYLLLVRFFSIDIMRRDVTGV